MKLSRSLVLVEFASIRRALLPASFIPKKVAGKTHVERCGAPWSADERTSPVPGSQEVGLPSCLSVCGSGGGDVDVGMAEIFKRCPQLSEGAGLSAGTNSIDQKPTTASGRANFECINWSIARELSELKRECWSALRVLGAFTGGRDGNIFLPQRLFSTWRRFPRRTTVERRRFSKLLFNCEPLVLYDCCM